MIETRVDIQTRDGVADGFLFQPDVSVAPGVIHLTDIGGIRPAQNQMARRLAEQGYTVLMPNIFYRTGRPPLIEFPLKSGEDAAKRMAELTTPLTPDAIERDGKAYAGFLTDQSSKRKSPIGIVGYCYSGALAVRIAAALPHIVAAVASFHAGRLFVDAPQSPHLALPRIRARMYFGHAVQDKSMPQEAIDKFEDALKNWGGRYETEVYSGAYHSWTTLDSPVYNPSQAERAFQKMTVLFAETLK